MFHLMAYCDNILILSYINNVEVRSLINYLYHVNLLIVMLMPIFHATRYLSHTDKMYLYYHHPKMT